MNRPKVPKVVMYMTGGIVQWSMANGPVDLLLIDGDTDGVDKHNLYKWRDINGVDDKSWVPHLGRVGTNNLEFVDRVYGQIEAGDVEDQGGEDVETTEDSMKWISVNTRKPKIGQKVYCYFVMKRYDGTILKDTRLLYYLKYRLDQRKHVFSDKSELWHDMNLGETNWPVTHWMLEPSAPNQLARKVDGHENLYCNDK